jgi:hypothetical protein
MTDLFIQLYSLLPELFFCLLLPFYFYFFLLFFSSPIFSLVCCFSFSLLSFSSQITIDLHTTDSLPWTPYIRTTFSFHPTLQPKQNTFSFIFLSKDYFVLQCHGWRLELSKGKRCDQSWCKRLFISNNDDICTKDEFEVTAMCYNKLLVFWCLHLFIYFLSSSEA